MHKTNLVSAPNTTVMSQISFRQSTKFEVSDAFYEHMVYENLEYIVQKYVALQEEQDQKDLQKIKDEQDPAEKEAQARQDALNDKEVEPERELTKKEKKKLKKAAMAPPEFVDRHNIIQDSLKRQMHQEIENVGVQLGRRIIDVITKDLSNVHQTQLDVVKYLCVQFWQYVFGKQIDNLKTNNLGTFVLYDTNKFLGRVSTTPLPSGEKNPDCLDRQITYSFYIVGLIKGALKNLGAAPGGHPMNVQIDKIDQPVQPFEIQIRIDLPTIKDE